MGDKSLRAVTKTISLHSGKTFLFKLKNFAWRKGGSVQRWKLFEKIRT